MSVTSRSLWSHCSGRKRNCSVAAVWFGVRGLLVGRFMETTNDAYLKADQVTVSPNSGPLLSLPSAPLLSKISLPGLLQLVGFGTPAVP